MIRKKGKKNITKKCCWLSIYRKIKKKKKILNNLYKLINKYIEIKERKISVLMANKWRNLVLKNIENIINLLILKTIFI